jgi:hypothetical protein
VSDAFRIQIIDQGWLDPAPGYDPARQDLCSHGDIRLVIGGETIAEGTGARGYGISEAALALLRTLESDHTADDRVAERLVPHGCGTILMMGCPIGIDWTVLHRDGGRVRITDVVRYDDTAESTAQRFPAAEVELSADDYCREVVAFAETAKEPFAGVEKTPFDEDDRVDYEAFWTEYNERLERAAARYGK